MSSRQQDITGTASVLSSTLKAAQAVGVLRDEGWQDLDCDVAFKDRVPGAIDLAHAACTQRAEDFIDIEPCAGGQRHDGGL
jgi:hypothetical protein